MGIGSRKTQYVLCPPAYSTEVRLFLHFHVEGKVAQILLDLMRLCNFLIPISLMSAPIEVWLKKT